MDRPTFCRIEYWNPTSATWVVGHSGINLVNPALYVTKLAARGTIGRAIDIETGEEVYGEGGDLL